jgi:ABC-type polysaccharide/polyol phosphate export permease
MTVAERLVELAAYRGLVRSLTIRDLKLKYRRSVLGAAWSVLNPLLMMAIYYAIFSVFLRVFTLPNYWAYVLGGLVAWLFFANALGSAVTSLVSNPNLITKVYFPIESLPIATVLSACVNFLVSLLVLVVVVAVARLPVGPSLMVLPVVVAAQLAFTVGLAVFVAALTVYLRDLEHLVGLFLTALFYVTPVLYPLEMAGSYAVWLELNPMTWFLECYHAILYRGAWPDPGFLALSIAAALVSLAGGYLLFLRMRPRLPEEL